MDWQAQTRSDAISSHHRLIDIRWTRTDPPEGLWPYTISYSDVLNSAFQLNALCLRQSNTLELKTFLGQPVGFGLATAPGARRWLSGIVTGVKSLGDASGFTLIGLRVESALSLLGRRLTCRIFQDQSVPQIVATILDEHRYKNSQIAAAFSHSSTLQREYKPRSYCVQYNESDQDFIERLLAEEGITYRFSFESDAPQHQLILSDDLLPEGEITHHLRYRAQAETVGPEEHILIDWRAHRQLIGSSVEMSSYDYKPAQALQGKDRSIERQGEAGEQAASTLSEYRALTQYYADNNTDMDRYARLRMQAQELQAKTFHGEGRLRTLATGQGFLLEDHPAHADDTSEQRSFVVTGITLKARNNLPDSWTLPEALRAQAHREIDQCSDDLHDPDSTDSVYCRFSAVRRDVPLVPAYADRLARPTAPGPQTAIVVGPPAEEVYTDELGRIRVQLHAQRPDEHTNGTANHDERSSTWIRVAMPSAGEGFGHQFLPRVGHEVLIDFIAGDIDRPIIVGTIHNGRHPPPEFSGMRGLPGNRALSGIRTREHHGSGYSELLMDDTPGQVRARLAATPHATELNLGKLTTPRQDGESQPRGDGAELRSDAAIAVRAAQGLLLTTYARHMAQGTQLDRQELTTLLDECVGLFRGLGQTAAARGAQGADDGGLVQLRDALAAWPEPGSEGGEPVAAIAGAAGIVTGTPRSQLHYAGENHDVAATDNVQSVSGGATRLHAGKGVSLYAQEEGIRTIANSGKVLIQAQEDDVAINAQKNLHLSASEGEVVVTAPTIRLVADDGSYIRIGNGVEIGTQGKAVVHAASHDWQGPKTDNSPLPSFGRDPAARQYRLHYQGDIAAVATGLAYQLMLDDGSKVQGQVSASGHSERVERDEMSRVSLVARQEAKDAATIPPSWKVADLLKLLCPDDKAVVDQLAQTDVQVADRIYFDDVYYDGTEWGTKRFEAGGTSSTDDKVIGLLSGTSPEDAVNTVYHEIRHQNQPEDMPWREKEEDAYYATEAWTIAKGLPGQGGDVLRTTNADGSVVPDRQAVRDLVNDHYPIPTSANGPIPVGHDKESGQTILSDGSQRDPILGDTYPGEMVTEGQRTIPKSVWKCPGLQ
ncbi:type VI secretion system tip protein TssI/VgrG [Stenotrophomonas terrae]|uniref:type VI secretion system Vgr family protein n=1 Tax=Stenotrophomonas terrae TaxID=405446 RepID=UPI003208B8FA